MENINIILPFLEADQSYMTPKQLLRDIGSRKQHARVGFEIEMYSDYSVHELYSYIKNESDMYPLLSKNYDVTGDGSLPDKSEVGGSGEYENEDFLNDPLEYLIETGVTYEEIVDRVIGDTYQSEYDEGNTNFDGFKNNILTILSDYKSKLEGIENADSIVSSIDDVESSLNDMDLSDYIDGISKVDQYISGLKSELSDKADIVLVREMIDAIDAIDTDFEDYDEDGYNLGLLYSMDQFHNFIDTYIEINGSIDDQLRDYYEYYATIEDDNYGDYPDIDPDDIGEYGVEVITNVPINLNQAHAYIKELSKLCNDPALNNISTYFGSEQSYGNTGLHIHFGLVRGYEHNMCDIIRLIKNTAEKEDKILALSNRPTTYYSESVLDKYYVFVDSIDSAFMVNTLNDILRTRYLGLNLTNLLGAGSKNTAEFRYAAASTAFNENQFKDYFDLLSQIVTDSFTGETKVQIGEYTITNRKDNNNYNWLIVSKDGKVINKGKLNPLDGLKYDRYNSVISRFRESKKRVEELTNKYELAKTDNNLDIDVIESNLQHYKENLKNIIDEVKRLREKKPKE